MKAISIFIKVLVCAALSVGVYFETGIWTTLAVIYLFVCVSAAALAFTKLVELLKVMTEDRFGVGVVDKNEKEN